MVVLIFLERGEVYDCIRFLKGTVTQKKINNNGSSVYVSCLNDTYSHKKHFNYCLMKFISDNHANIITMHMNLQKDIQ